MLWYYTPLLLLLPATRWLYRWYYVELGPRIHGLTAPRNGVSVPRTIALRSKSNGILCLDVPGAVAQKPFIQLWECNGHTNQLWLFDEGSWMIKYAADPTKCLDAGNPPKGSTQGALLMMWDCNGLSQQRFGYDANLGTIYLKDSVMDASLCVDVFSPMKMGNQVQLWSCNVEPQQVFDVNWGTTIRINQNYKLCVDVIQPAAAGSLMQIWGCNGLPNQQFIYDDSVGQLKYGGDPTLNLCVDAHAVGPTGTQLKLWGCYTIPQQQWGYDASMQTIYLRTSTVANYHVAASTSTQSRSNSTQPMATICMDLYNGDFTPGQIVETWGCNGCWNQQFILGGGVTQQAEWRPSSSPSPAALGGCPPIPSPSPSPPGNCANGWPQFNSAQELKADPWGDYIAEVYGQVPQAATYPWCMADLWAVYTDRLTAHGAKTPASVGACPTNKGATAGQLYSINNQFQPSNMAWIWHPAPFTPFADNTWVEVIHMSGLADENTGAWFFYAKGSGIWFNLGKTIHFTDHGDAYKFFHAHDNPDMSGKAGLAGYDSVQFLAHTDCEFKHCSRSTPYMNYEIVATKLVGRFSCTSSSGQSSLLQTGWPGSMNTCNCNNRHNNLNCQGVPIQPVKPPLGNC